MSRMSWVLLGALAMTSILAWFSSQLIATAPNQQPVLPMEPTPAGALDNVVRSAECDGLKTVLESELLSATHCSVDDDCEVIRLDFPFDCASAIASTSFVSIYRLQDEFTAACGVCQSACTEDPPAAVCRRGRCVLDVAAGLRQSDRPGLPERPQAPPSREPEG